MKQLITYFRNNTNGHLRQAFLQKWPPILKNMAKTALPYAPFATWEQIKAQQAPITANDIVHMQEENRYYRYTTVVTKREMLKKA